MCDDNSCNEIGYKNRCKECNKKIPISAPKCQCGNFFCSIHRYTDTHKCPIDYKTLGKNKILKENPKIKSNKL